jgi:hypothetical protein
VLSYNVQASTNTAAGIVIAIEATQTAPDYAHLVPAVQQIEKRTGRDRKCRVGRNRTL